MRKADRKEKKKTTLTVEERALAEMTKLVFEELFDSEQKIKACANLLADCIRFAHQAGNDCWSLTLYPQKIRLNVGPVEVLVLNQDNVFLLVNGTYYDDLVASRSFFELNDDDDNDIDPDSDDPRPTITAPGLFYSSVPHPQIICFLPPETLENVYPIITDAHRSFIAIAAGLRKKSAWRSSFSPGVILFLNQLLGTSLPTPGYFSGKLESELIFPDEIRATNLYHEGAVSKVLVNVYERDPEARKACIKHYGLSCYVCNFNFEAVYGERGKGFIHVHHLKPVSDGEYRVNPIADLRPICPNCHAMIHRYGLLSIEELKQLLGRNTSQTG